MTWWERLTRWEERHQFGIDLTLMLATGLLVVPLSASIASAWTSVLAGLVWNALGAAGAGPTATWIVFGVYLFFTTVLFCTVAWSKFAHMFFKPAVAYQRRVEEADGSSDLPRPSTENYIVRS